MQGFSSPTSSNSAVTPTHWEPQKSSPSGSPEVGLTQGHRVPPLKPLKKVWAELALGPRLLTPGFVGFLQSQTDTN